MGVPKPKHRVPTRRSVRRPAPPTAAERAAAEDRADVETYDKAIADWEARGRPAGIPWEEAEHELDRLK